jgi:hypothetical protein
MSKLRVATLVFCVGVAAVGVSACSSNSSSSTTTAAAASTKAAFCGFNVTLDKAGSAVTSDADFLNVLKANKAAIDGMANNVPGAIKAQAQAIINAARTAVANNSTSGLDLPSLNTDGAALDTFCGVQGDGTPLPANFAAGKGSGFCADEAVLSSGLGNAASPADALAFLKANQAKVTDFAANIPSAVQSDGQVLVAAANAALAANDGTLIQTQAVQTSGNNVDLYCGVNH